MDNERRRAKEMVKNLSFKEKVEHFLHYYGKYTVLSIIALAIVVYTLVDCMMQVKYDLDIAYYTCSRVNREGSEALADSLEPVINDITGNEINDVLVNVSEADISKDGYDEMVKAVLTKISVELSADEYQMYILDSYYLEYFNRAFEGIIEESLLISDIPEIRESLGVPEGEELYLVLTTSFEQSKGKKDKAAEHENAVLVMEYFKNQVK